MVNMRQTLQQIHNDIVALPRNHTNQAHNLKSMIITQLHGLCHHESEYHSFDVLTYIDGVHYVAVAVAYKKNGGLFERLAKYSSTKNVLEALEKMWHASLKSMGVSMDVVQQDHGDGVQMF